VSKLQLCLSEMAERRKNVIKSNLKKEGSNIDIESACSSILDSKDKQVRKITDEKLESIL
jgi:hypothetical protein